MDWSNYKGGTLRMKDKGGSQKFDLNLSSFAQSKEDDVTNTSVSTPSDQTQEDWLASKIVDFYNQINLLYGTLSKHCTEQACTSMTAGPKFEYLWQWDKEKPAIVSAPKYIDNLMTWIEDMLHNPAIFPEESTPFPKKWKERYAVNIFRRLFRVYAHMYYHHTQDIVEVGVDKQLFASFRHFYLIVKEYNLIREQELQPLSNLIEKINEEQ